jgi:hypothetical protein
MDHYPVIILDVGVSFNDRRIMNKLGKMNTHDLPWDTPLLTSIAYRIWEDEKKSDDIVVEYSLPPAFIPKKEREEYENKIAKSCNLELSGMALN